MRRILIVDDSPNDWLLIRRALAKRHPGCFVFEVDEVPRAIQYLEGQGKFSNRTVYPMPNLILCDGALPPHDGFELLDFVAGNSFPDLKVALMSGSLSKEKRARAREKGACACIDKNDILSDATTFLEAVEDCLNGVDAI